MDFLGKVSSVREGPEVSSKWTGRSQASSRRVMEQRTLFFI